MQIAATPQRSPDSRSRCARVPRMRVPDAPSGCPIAIAPPLVFTISGSMPHASTHASDCTANASFSSTADTSDQVIPARASARSAASIGAIPNSCGSSAADAAAGHPGQRRQPDPVSGGLRAEEYGGRAVVQRRRVGRRDRAVLAERRLQAGQLLGGRPRPDPLVAGELRVRAPGPRGRRRTRRPRPRRRGCASARRTRPAARGRSRTCRRAARWPRPARPSTPPASAR